MNHSIGFFPLFRLRHLLCLLLLFTALPAIAQQPDTKVTLGIKPDYLFSGKGVRVKGILPGKTAEKYGIKTGDVILAFDEKPIKNVFAYRDLLSEYNPGDKVKIKLLRGDKTIFAEVTF